MTREGLLSRFPDRNPDAQPMGMRLRILPCRDASASTPAAIYTYISPAPSEQCLIQHKHSTAVNCRDVFSGKATKTKNVAIPPLQITIRTHSHPRTTHTQSHGNLGRRSSDLPTACQAFMTAGKRHNSGQERGEDFDGHGHRGCR